MGCLKNIGRIYQLTACDCFSSFGWAKLYLHKNGDSAVDFLETDLLPKAGHIVIQRLLQDNGKGFTTTSPGPITSSSKPVTETISGIASPGRSIPEPMVTPKGLTRQSSMNSTALPCERRYTTLSKSYRKIYSCINITSIETIEAIRLRGTDTSPKPGVLQRQNPSCLATGSMMYQMGHPEEKSVNYSVNTLTR